jgi:4-carboxymuconolactone decarboxylase
MTPEQSRVHDAIASGPRGSVRGPLAMWLHQPEFAARAQALGEYCRYHTSLPKRLSELAILITAREWSAEYEWMAHRQFARDAGVSEAVIEAIRTHQTPALDMAEQVVYDIARTMYRDRRLDDALFGRGVAALGEAGMVDLIGVLGYYALISMTINAFSVALPEGARPAFGEGPGA